MGIVNILMSLLGIASLGGIIILWIVSVVQLLQRSDLKNSKGLWAVLIIFLGILGSTIFFFTEGRKKLGVWSLVCMIGLPVVMILWVVAGIVGSVSSSATLTL